MRLTHSVVRSFDRDIGAVIARLERHARVADQTAVAMELVRAAEFRQEACQRQHEELRLQCERWLKPANVKDIHIYQVRAKLDGTCDWIASNDIFERWVKPEPSTSRDRFLVISGTHGCGKSVLASSIVARLEKAKQHILFFSFSSSDGSRQTSENLIRTLLWRLLQETADKGSVDTVHRLSLDGQPTISELWEAFGRIALTLAKPIYCVVDGIDECIDYNHTVSITIMQILEKLPDLRMLLLGRPHVFRAHSGNSPFVTIEITSAMLSQDIEALINDEVAKSDILSLPEFRKNVYEILKDKSDGMFLWVRLMVDDLNKSSSKSEFSERLQNLPCGLEKAYQILLLHLSERLDKYELRLAQTTLAFTTTSCRPLHFDELRYAFAIHCRSLEAMAQPLEKYLLLQPPQKILDVTGGLISMTDGVLRLIHSSVKEFLIRPKDQWICEPDTAVVDFRVDIMLTHRSFAWLCLDYMNVEKDERSILKPNMSQSTQTSSDNYPLLGYATVYTFFHLNRSGSPCSITLAKIESVLKSTQSLLWMQHFAYLLFEDITLQSQMEEFTAWSDQMTVAGLDEKFLAFFKETLEERNDEMRKVGKKIDPLTENLETYIKQIMEESFEVLSQKQSNKTTASGLKSCTAGPNLETNSQNSTPTSNDPFATVSRAMNLLKGQTSLSVAHQIELWVRLSTSLDKISGMIDPLKVLFRIVLRKASGIHVFALLAIAHFYRRLEKYQEAVEVYSVTSRKMNHLDVPLKFKIYFWMGDCYEKLGLNTEALRSFESAFSGQEIHLGRRHYHTLRTLYCMIVVNEWMYRYTEVLRLSDKICMEQEFVPEMSLSRNLNLHIRRHRAYRRTGNHDREAHVEESIRATVNLCHKAYSNDDDISPGFSIDFGHAYTWLGEHATALKFFQLGFEACKNSKRSSLSLILYIQYRIACTFRRLGRIPEAKDLLETVLAKQQRLLGPNHRRIRWTKEALDDLESDDNELTEEDDEHELDEEEDRYRSDEGEMNVSRMKRKMGMSWNEDELNDDELNITDHCWSLM